MRCNAAAKYRLSQHTQPGRYLTATQPGYGTLNSTVVPFTRSLLRGYDTVALATPAVASAGTHTGPAKK